MFCYAIATAEGVTFQTHEAVLRTLAAWGFQVNPLIRPAVDIEECIHYYHHIGQMREELPYEIDGIVIKVNDLRLQERLGAVSRSPRWAVACKFAAIRERTVIEDIVIQVGRTGVLTPVAVIERSASAASWSAGRPSTTRTRSEKRYPHRGYGDDSAGG